MKGAQYSRSSLRMQRHLDVPWDTFSGIPYFMGMASLPAITIMHPLSILFSLASPASAWRYALARQYGLMLFLLLMAGLIQSHDALAKSPGQMEHHRWLGADGGPSQVGAIAQTADGYLWLGTNDSLFRFDGFDFSRYRAPDDKIIGTVSSLLAVEDELWVGLRAGGIVRIRPQMLTRFEAGQVQPGVVYGMARTRDGAIWAASEEGLSRFDGRRWQTEWQHWKLPDRRARAVFVDRTDTLWLATAGKLYYLPSGTKTFIDAGISVDWIGGITQAPDGTIWLSERYKGVLYRVLREHTKPVVQTLPVDTPASSLYIDHDGGLWISTLGKGIRYLDFPIDTAGLRHPQIFAFPDGLSSNYIWPIFGDREHNIWIGTSAGLDRLRPRVLMPSSLPTDGLNYALAPSHDGAIWAGTSNQGLTHLQAHRAQRFPVDSPITAAMRDTRGDVWIAGPAGIWQTVKDKPRFVTRLPDGAASDSSVRAMALGAKGDLWVSVNRLGLFVWKDKTWHKMPAISQESNQVMPVSASSDAQGNPWFGYRDNLLVRQGADSVTKWGIEEGMKIGHITAILHHAGRTWVGGQNGMGWIENDRFHALPVPEGCAFGSVYAILAVETSGSARAMPELWVHTRSGIFQIESSELEHVSASRQHRLRYRSYGRLSGLANDPYQVLPLPTAIRSDDNRLWFSTSNGVFWIDPATVQSDLAGPVTHIESVMVDGAVVQGLQPREFSSSVQRVVMDYTALSLSAPETVSFSYRLDGYDDDWQVAGRRRTATYTGLGAGEYRFRVVARDQDGIPSAQEATYTFSIAPTFYTRPIFLAAAALFTILLIALFYFWSMRKMHQRMHDRLDARHGERERIARELHDTLLQGVQGLLLRLQVIANAMPGQARERGELEQALARTEKMVEEGRDRVRDLRDAQVPVRVDLAQRLEELGQTLASDGGALFEMKTIGAPVVLSAAMHRDLHGIGHEAIVNAFLHAQARKVTVELVYAATRIRLIIRDDGIGIPSAYLKMGGKEGHWGLAGMQERADEIGALLSIRVRDQGGTTIDALVCLRGCRLLKLQRWLKKVAGWREND